MNSIQKPTFIVTTEHGRWGAHERLAEACRNAKLEEQSIAEASCHEVQTALEWHEAVDWSNVREAAEDACIPDDYPDTVEIVIYFCDTRYWTGWSIDGIDGGITFHGFKGGETGGKEVMARSTVRATWTNGEIKPRKETSARAA